MEQKIELKGPAGIVAVLVIAVGLLVWKGPSGVIDMIRSGGVRPGLSEETLNTKGREEIRAELQHDYRKRYVEPLMKTIGDNPSGHPAEAAELVKIVSTIDSLKLTRLTSSFRHRLDTGDRLELHIDVQYTMEPAPPDGVGSRKYSVDVYKRGRGRWEIRSAD
ncbi:MAG: hypothetical protein ISQ14_15690 [Verrucomicrobiae bacterium]|nr:hypothetical protein [Verrucomicrobiae bacterium]